MVFSEYLRLHFLCYIPGFQLFINSLLKLRQDIIIPSQMFRPQDFFSRRGKQNQNLKLPFDIGVPFPTWLEIFDPAASLH